MTATPKAAAPPTDAAAPASYLDLYGLSKPPFGKDADAANYILFASHRRCFELLVDHMMNGSGLILLLGAEGVGKTETLRAAGDVAAESGMPVIRVMRPPNGRVTLAAFTAALPGGADPEATAVEPVHAILSPPRKALLLDDVDLLPPDALQLLLRLLQPSTEASGIAVVATSTADIAAAPPRPEFGELAGLARTSVRLSPIGLSESRQYIERLLWMSGGTTRRLIAPDALRQIIARSGGLPGAINRQMEAAFTAGFVRGDVRITARTVAATARPIGHQPKPAAAVQASLAARILSAVAIALLAVGMATFLFKALSDRHGQPAATPSPAQVQPPASPGTHASAAAPPPQARTPETLPPDVMAALLKRGEEFVALGDLAAARLLFQRAAEAGSARAALAMGRTYDPEYLSLGAAQGVRPDLARAMAWYQKSAVLGDAQAEALTRRAERRGADKDR